MKNFKIKLRRKSLIKILQIKETINSYIRPFKQMPSVNNTGRESADRINAHDLFSHYTAEIIKEDTVFNR